MIRAFCIFLLSLFVTLAASAQEKNRALAAETTSDNPATASIEDDTEYLNGMVPIAPFSQEDDLPDSLHLPTVDYNTIIPPHNVHPYSTFASPYGWNLHPGFNAAVDLSAFTSFGKNHFSGTAERISAMYAAAINDHLSLAVGGYFSNMNTNRGNFLAAGVAAILDYRFNEHWEAYLYAQKNLMHSSSNNRFMPWNGMYAYDYFGNMADRIGLGLRYNFNESTYVEVQFDFERMPYSLPQPPATMRQSGDSMNRSIEKSSPIPSQNNTLPSQPDPRR